MSPAPLVSVLIPCFNAEQWLGACVESVLAQTWGQIEVVVVNDGSTDGSLDVARRYEQPGVFVVDRPNGGAAAARNAALASARGAFIQYLDADDLLAPDKIERQMALLAERRPGTVASGAWGRFVSDPADVEFVPAANWADLTGVEFLQLHYEQQVMMQPAAWLTPRTVIDRIGPWNERLSLNDDGEYFARVVLAASGIAFCASARSYYRTHVDTSLSRRRDSAALASLFESCRLMTAHLLEADGSDRSRAAAAFAWKWLAFELHPAAEELSRDAEARAAALGGSSRPFPAGRRFEMAARMVGWRMAKRLRG